VRPGLALRTLHLVIIALLFVGITTHIRAQDLEPRAYSNSPIGLNFILAGFGHTTGSVLTDPALPVENVSVESDFGLFAFATTLDVFGQSGKIDVVLPYASLFAEGLVFGVPHVREVDGFGDPALRFSANFIGAPALTAAEFGSYKQDLIVGASIRVGIPVGQYDDDKLVNVGSNRWSFKPEIGISKAVGAWTFEVAPAVALYTDNDSFFNGKTREQAPLYSVQTHINYTFRPGFWFGLNGAYFNGARSTVDGVVNDDRQEGTRLGLTLAIPINRHHSAKIYAITGFNGHGDHDFEAFGLAWQYRWGGGY
jgi:hypothetical protein